MRGAGAVLTVLLAVACVRAMKEPPPLLDPAAPGGGTGADSVAALLTEAEVLYSHRVQEDVRRAADLWLEAARAEGGSLETLTGLARARVWLADHEPDSSDREAAAIGAVHAAQWCDRIADGDPACDFWLGVALGVQARERRGTALDALPRIVEAFQRAAAAQPLLEEAGPDRALALLYARAPGWPAGPGDPDLALEHARKAVELRPGFPPNQLALAEALAEAGDRSRSVETYRHALDLARAAALRGDPDATDWIEQAWRALGQRRGE